MYRLIQACSAVTSWSYPRDHKIAAELNFKMSHSMRNYGDETDDENDPSV